MRATVPRAMGHLSVTDLAYGHPGGDLLFTGVSFRVPEGLKDSDIRNKLTQVKLTGAYRLDKRVMRQLR